MIYQVITAVIWTLFACWSADPAAAQSTYSVFTVKAPDSNVATVQPTWSDAGVPITLVAKDSSLDYVIQALAHQAHLLPVYDKANPLFAKHVTVRLVNVGAMNAFATVLKGTGFVATLRSDRVTVMIGVPSASSRAHLFDGVIAGRVTDSASGAGLGGAVVRVAGTKLSAVTSDSGNFTLRDVPTGNQVVTIRLFGYRPVDRAVTVVDSQRTILRIAMVSVPTVLSGVVTTAAGIQRKVEVGNDITTLNVDSVMRVAPISSVTDLLETRVPGLTVLHSSGVPGDPARIRIRGASSITGNNDPIVIVDGIRVYSSQSDPRNNNLAPSSRGVNSQTINGNTITSATPSPIDQIDPNSIETIEVFKGPSASALYGSDAANGVIVITTKHGHAGPTHWSLALGTGVNWLPGAWPTNYYRFGHELGVFNIIPAGAATSYCGSYDPYCIQDSLVAFQALNDPRFSLFSHGSDQTASLTVSGGVPTLQYNLTGSAAGDIGNLKLDRWDQQQYEQVYGPIPSWMVHPDNYQTYGGSGQVTAQPAPNFRVTLNTSLLNSHQQQGSLQSGIAQLEGEYINVAGNAVYRLDNTNTNQAQTKVRPFNFGPLISGEVERVTADAMTSNNNVTIGWQPRSWLPLTATGGFQTVQRTDQAYVPYGISNSGYSAVGSVSDPGGSLTVADSGFYGLGHGLTVDKTLTVGTTIPSWHVNTAIGGNWHSESTNDFSASTSQLAPGVSTPTVLLYPAGSGPIQSTLSSSTYGVYVQPQIHVFGSLYLNPGFRLDGGSASGSNGGLSGSGLTGFPKIDLSYVAIDQNRPRGIVTLLRPRLAFGVAGTQPGPTEKLRILNAGGTQLVVLNDSTTAPGVVFSTLGNTHLEPETSRDLEGGFDIELWRGRLSTTYTRYDKTRYNAIIQVPIAPSVLGLFELTNNNGILTSNGLLATFYQNVNVGEIRNTGTELTLNARIVDSRAVGWMVGMNLSNDNNRVVRLAPGFAPNKLLGIVAGYPLFGDWAKRIVSYADVNNDGKIEAGEYQVGDSVTYVGQADPKYQMNLNTNISLFNGRLSINATFAYQNGMTQNNQAAYQSQQVQIMSNTPGLSLGSQAAFLAATCNSFGATHSVGLNGCQASTIGMYQTVNTFRFNDLSINYNLPRAFSRMLHVPRASLALQGSNLALHTNYRGVDPDVNAFSTASGGGDQTVDTGQLPQPRIWWLKVNLGN